jgi:hypothetical protein
MADRAFLFALLGSGISSPCKMNMRVVNDRNAIYDHSSYGPTFGWGYDMSVQESNVNICTSSYQPWSLPLGKYPIKEMEVFQVTSTTAARIVTSTGNQANNIPVIKLVSKFTESINKAINTKQECLLRAESEMLQLEESFKDEQTFIMKFASGDTKDVVVLNVSGTVMVTKRSTLCTAKDSVLAQQFDDSKRTEQGCNAPRVNEWNPDQVSTWAKSVDGLPEDVSIILYENKITGRNYLH